LIGLGYSKRGPLATVKDLFPNIIISEGITEEDDLWAATGGNESEEEAGERVESAFKEVWDMAKDDDCLSFSSITMIRADYQVSPSYPIKRHSIPSGLESLELKNRGSKLPK
jgi:hypothetical protein